MRLVWSRLAVQELHAVRRDSIDQWGRDVALRYLQDIRDAAIQAAARPGMARELRDDLRLVRMRSHYPIIHVNEHASTVTIARVLHGAMDIERHLP